jgi:hypothetical protein
MPCWYYWQKKNLVNQNNTNSPTSMCHILRTSHTGKRWQQLTKMRKILFILLTIAIASSCYGQIDSNPNWIYFNNITVKEFVDTLSIKHSKPNTIYILVTGNKAKVGWIKESDVDFLVELIDSKAPAYCVMQVISSQLPINEESTIGGQVMNLIDSYRFNKEYPFFLTDCSKNDEYRKQEILNWYNSFKEGK